MAALFCSTVGAVFFGYVMAGFGTNLYTIGYKQGLMQPLDYSLTVMQGLGMHEKTKYLMQHSLLMHQVLL